MMEQVALALHLVQLSTQKLFASLLIHNAETKVRYNDSGWCPVTFGRHTTLYQLTKLYVKHIRDILARVALHTTSKSGSREKRQENTVGEMETYTRCIKLFTCA